MFRVLLPVLFIASAAAAELSVCGTEELLPIGFTEEELLDIKLNGWQFETRFTAPPPSGTRNPAEFEPATGVFVRWPLGLPYDLLISFSEASTLWVICEAGAQGSAYSALSAAGVNMDNVEFVLRETNSVWVRDYGPWFIMLPDGTIGIFDYTYNRPSRPLDNLIPSGIGEDWGIDVYASEIIHSGGNYMSGGLGQSMSTNLVYDENWPPHNEEWVDTQMETYLGVTDYVTMDDPLGSYIDHIDCWSKILSPTKIIVLQVSPGNPDYAALESCADMFESTQTPYGTNWEVYRVYSSGTEGYSNSLIHNDRVYLPVWNTSNDTPAIASYQEALPGYTIIPIYYGAFSSSDALHCRTRNVMDPEMLWINHVPVSNTQTAGNTVTIEAFIRCHPDNSLTSTVLNYRTGTSGAFTPVTMIPMGSDSFYADIPGFSAGTTVQYYISAVDNSSRQEEHPRFAPDSWCHQYVTTGTGIESEESIAPGIFAAAPVPNPFHSSTEFIFSCEDPCFAEIAVYDLSGRKITTLNEEQISSGSHSLVWSPGEQVAGGIYLVRFQLAETAWTRHVTYLGR